MIRILPCEWIDEYGLGLIREWASQGLSDKEIFTQMGISQNTFYVWKKKYPEITKTIRDARLERTTEIGDALFERACEEDFNEEVESTLAGIKLDFKSFTLLFLPEDAQKFKEGIAQFAQFAAFDNDIFVARLEDFEYLLQAQSKVQAAYNVESIATALNVILDIFNRHHEDLAEGYVHKNGKIKHTGKVPISSVFGEDNIPSELATKLRSAVKKAVKKGVIQEENKTDFLRILLEKYLAGGK